MEIRVFIDLDTEEDLPTDPYSIRLSIKNTTTEAFPVPEWTIPDKIGTGQFEYTFTAEANVVYLVTWRIVAAFGADAIDKTEHIGPFEDIVDEGIRSVASYRGSFKRGTIATLMLKITDFDGNPRDPEEIDLTIRTETGTLVKSTIPEKATEGFFVHDWEISATQTPGEYMIVWRYIVDEIPHSEFQQVVVVDDADENTMLYSGNAYLLRLALESYLACAQNIPVYFEQAKPTVDNKTYRLTFPRWNQSTGIKVYRDKQLVVTNLEIDYFKGTILFDDYLTDYDIINVDYNFQWFSDQDLNGFLENAIQTINQFPPHSGYTFTTLPTRYGPAVIYKAATDALRRLMLCLQFQESQQVFGGPEGAQKAFANMETLKKNYEEEWKLLYEQKKFGPYVGLTRAVVVPEFTLPGGRSRWFRYLFKGGQ